MPWIITAVTADQWEESPAGELRYLSEVRPLWSTWTKEIDKAHVYPVREEADDVLANLGRLLPVADLFPGFSDVKVTEWRKP